MSKITVILGSGASADVWNRSYDPPVEWAPPLASELFGTWGSAELVRPILEKYRGANHLSAQIVPFVGQKNFSIEQKFSEFAQTRENSPAVYKDFLEIPPYIRDLIFNVSKVYGSLSGSYAQLIHQLLGDSKHEVAFVTLNYDDLLEQELFRANRDIYSFEDFGDYIDPRRPAQVYKLHGSINWFRRLATYERHFPLDDWHTALRVRDPIAKPEGNIVVRHGILQSTDPYHSGGVDYWMYPVVTAPLASKSASDIAIPTNFLAYLESFLAECHYFIVIGCSGIDQDLIDVLKRSIKMVERIQYVADSGVAGKNMVSNFTNGVGAFFDVQYSSPQPGVFERGFREFMRSANFDSFVQGIR